MAGSRVRVAVLGGGVLGVSTAAALAGHGAQVTLLTEGALASGASGRSLAWLNSFGVRSPEYHELRLAGLDRYRSLAGRIDASTFLRFDGGLTWADEDQADGHRQAFEHMRSAGYRAVWVTPAQVRAVTPGVDPAAFGADGGIFVPQEGWVDLPGLIGHLAGEVRRCDGVIRTGAGPAEVVVTGDRVTGVRTADGRESSVDAAVLATGAEVPRTLERFGVRIPDATTTGLLVRARPAGTSLRAVLNTPRVAVRPAPGGALVMDAGWSEREVGVLPDGSYDVRQETIQGLLDAASAVLEGRPRLTCESYGVGPKPVPGDGEPVLGPLDGISGLFVAFTHSGATLGLVAGELLADWVVEGRAHPLLRPYQPGRFR